MLDDFIGFYVPSLYLHSFLAKHMKIFLSFLLNALILLEAYRFNDETDKQALLDFKSQVSEVQRDVLSSWNNSFPLCKWKGVTCAKEQKRVISLDLGGLNLRGVIPPSIGNLSFLNFLNLESNYFVGRIPREIGNLSRLLDLDLSSNRLGNGVPPELGTLTKLTTLYLGENNLRGKLPTSLGNLTLLEQLDVFDNNLQEGIPDISRLTKMVRLSFAWNNFSDVLPPGIYNMSSLKSLDISSNHFFGDLRFDFGDLLPNIEHLNMENNYFTGAIPHSFGKLKNLQVLSLFGNYLGSYSSGDLEFLEALTNCTKLHSLDVSQNKLGGDLPTSIVNMSKNLNTLSLRENQISGGIPYEIGNLESLQSLRLEMNILTQPLPKSLGTLTQLVKLYLDDNLLSGEISPAIGNLTHLVTLGLSNNNFERMIPPSIGNCNQLRNLDIQYNKLSGQLPQSLGNCLSMEELNLRGNSFNGNIPDISRLIGLTRIDLSNNNLHGSIPNISWLMGLTRIDLSNNNLHGSIPNISRLVGLTNINLSSNNLHGSIPAYLANFTKLQYLNLSFNNLHGEVPTQGVFKDINPFSLIGNKNLCGGIKVLKLKPCSKQALSIGTKHSSHMKKVTIAVSLSILVMLFISLVSLYWFRKRNKNQTSNAIPFTLGEFHENISYAELRNATDGFSSDNIIGAGSFGIVFKAILPSDNKVVVVKVLKLQRKGAMKSFLAECGFLKDIRHRNLVKLLTVCSRIDSERNEFKALVYEFMSNGSLDMWLHPEEIEEINYWPLTLFERVSIAIDVASALEYLHAHCHEPIAHCDLKPSNVLLDDDLTAHVSDFGLARLLLKFDEDSFFNQLSSACVQGTIGYAAPEYGMGAQPSIHGDVYSFGVLVLEMLTGKRPTNDLFVGGFTLYNYTKSALPEQVLNITDKSILDSRFRRGFDVSECLVMIFQVGLRCCQESPTNRMTMSEAVRELILIKEKFFKARRTRIS